MHKFEKFGGDGVSGSEANNRIYRTLRAQGRLPVINPYNNLRGPEDTKAVKTATKAAPLQPFGATGQAISLRS